MKTRAIDNLKNAPPEIPVPWEVWSLWGHAAKRIDFAGDQASLGEDYAKLDRIRFALEWYVDQFGGNVKWEK